MAIELDKAERLPRSTSSASTNSSSKVSSWHDLMNLSIGGPPKVEARDRMFFTERLALLLDTGVPLHVALETLSRQAANPTMSKLVRSVCDAVSGGTTFAKALGEHRDAFPPTYVNLIAAAEKGGFLPTALERLRDMEERREELRSTMMSALSYPVILACFSLAVVVFVLVVVFPKFQDIFSMIHDQLPITTRWLMATSDVLRQWWIPILGGLAGTIKISRDWLKTVKGAESVDRMLFAIPGLRDIIVQLNIVQLLRVVGLSLDHGVPMVDALRSAREAVSSNRFRGFIDRVGIGIQEGRGLSAGFNSEPMIPDLVKQLIETGEESGKLPAVMSRLADFYEREWRRALDMIAKVSEPAMLLIMGCVVGLIVSSLILPIFKLSRAVH